MLKRKCDLCQEKDTELINFQKDSREVVLQKLFISLKTANFIIDQIQSICAKCNVDIDECYSFYKRVKSAIFASHYSFNQEEPISKEDAIDPIRIEVKIEIENELEDQNNESLSPSERVSYLKKKTENNFDYGGNISKNSSINNETEIGKEAIYNYDNRQKNILVVESIISGDKNEEVSNSLKGCKVKKLRCRFQNEKHKLKCNKKRKKNNNIKLSKTDFKEGIFKNYQPAQYTLNFDNFPKELMCDTKFVIPDYEKNRLLNMFYDLTCRICSQDDGEVPTYQQMPHLFNHYETVHKTRPYVMCCDKKLITRKSVLFHMAQHIQPSIFQCTLCSYFGATPGTLKSHVKLHQPESERPSYQCDECGKSFVEESRLKVHKLTHLPDELKKPFKCKFCDKIYYHGSRLTTHIAEDHKGRRFLCSDCGKSYKSKESYEIHLSSKHNIGESNKIKCQVCDIIMNKASVTRHMKRHGEPNVKCTLCDYKTYEKRILNHHMEMRHSDEKRHVCSVCNRAFKLKASMYMHMSQHTREAKFRCLFCPKVFFSCGNRHTHQNRMHKVEVKKKREEKEAERQKLLAEYNKTNPSIQSRVR